MAGSYELWLADDQGNRKLLVDDFLSLNATKVDGDKGVITVELKGNFDDSLLNKDWQWHLWRAPSGGTLSLFDAYLIRKVTYQTVGSEETILVKGYDGKDIIDRRIVAYAAGTDEANKTDAADDMMKEIVEENLGATAAGDRDMSALFSIQADVSAGPTLTKRFAWRNQLDVLQDLQEASRAEGTEVFFDVVPIPSATTLSWDFRTATGQPGADLTSGANQVVFDQERGNMRDPSYSPDWTDERNYVYGLGQGEGDDREQQDVEDTTSTAESFWSRAEAYADARLEEEANGVREEARALLEKRRAQIFFSATPVDTRGTRFGRDWNWGDKVIARYRGLEFEAIIRAVMISVREGTGETINARLEYEAAIT
jgi:hypothetical protein